MKKILALSFLFMFVFCEASYSQQKAEEIIEDSISMINEIFGEDDEESIAHTLKTSHAVAIVPSMLKAGFVFGGEYGEGLILRYEGGKWYGPSFYNLGGGSFGFQIGMQQVSLLLAVINRKGVEAFMSSKTKLGGDFAIAAGPLGRRAEAATDAQAKASIYSYSMSKGLFAGVSLDGAVISISVKRNKEYWGDSTTAAEALQKEAKDKRILPLIKVLDKLITKAK